MERGATKRFFFQFFFFDFALRFSPNAQFEFLCREGQKRMSTNSTGDELMNAKLNAGIIETSDVVESEQNTSIPVATVIDVGCRYIFQDR